MRADRLLSIMLRLQARKKWTTQDLAQELGVSKRTILRDIEALSIAGIPIYTQSGQGGGVALDENYRVALTGLKESEIYALYLSANLKILADIGLDHASENLLLKFFATLPSIQQQLVKDFNQRVFIDSTWWIDEQSPACLPELFAAVTHHRRLQVLYEYPDKTAGERLLEPYGLVAKGGSWYLIARREQEFRTYRISRFQQVRVLNEHFQRQPDFDLETFWRSHMHTFFESLLQYSFTLRIHHRQQAFVQRYSYGRFEIIEPTDVQGWFTARFEVESIELAKMLVFGLGCDAVVIQPQPLLDAVHHQSRTLLSGC